MFEPLTPAVSPTSEARFARRREAVFVLLSGLFLGTLTMLNILGIARFWAIAARDADGTWAIGRFADAGGLSFAVAIGVLPYPITFLCTDLLSEFYGRRRANLVVWVGLALNVWVVAVMWLAGAVPGGGPAEEAFFSIRALTFGAVAASMIAYLAAQFCDVYLFHFWKRLTRGRHLWLRNNASTLASQLVDTTAVILITHFVARALPIDDTSALWPQLWTLIATGYAFKAVAALLDTPVIYALSWWLARYLDLDPTAPNGAMDTPPAPADAGAA